MEVSSARTSRPPVKAGVVPMAKTIPAVSQESYKRAPPGFTVEQWEQFNRDGFLVFEHAISAEDVERYLAALDRVTAADPKFDDARFYGPGNAVERDPTLAELIDHPRHVGFVYDVYGELLKLHLSQAFVRPKDSSHNMWHPDGARALPYGVFCPVLPLQIKVGYWLTDLPEPGMGNLVALPGSHHEQYLDAYDTHESLPGERVFCFPRGTMTLMHCGVWHRVEANHSDVVRKNIFLAYCPAWLTPGDRYQNEPEWVQRLTREQRIIMRSYDRPYDNTKPPLEDFPLYLDRHTGADRDPGRYREQVGLHRRKRQASIETTLRQPSDSG